MVERLTSQSGDGVRIDLAAHFVFSGKLSEMAVTDSEKLQIMSDTAKPILDILNGRIKRNTETLLALNENALDTNIPDEVKKLREIESQKVRAVIQELNDCVDIIKALFPDVKPAKQPKKANQGG